jgi:protein-disulfide isomerase
MRPLTLGLLIASLAACSNAQTAASAQGATSAAPGTGSQDQVVAKVGDRAITLKDVEAKWQQEDPAERARVNQLLYQHRRQAIQQIVGDSLMEEAAKKAGQSKDAWLQAEIARRTGEVPEEEIKRVYELNKDRVGTQTLDQLRDSIRKFIAANREQQAEAQIVDELMSKAGNVQILLDPPRYDVAVAKDDPSRGPADAPVTIVEYSDFQCPFCSRVVPTLDELQKKYPGKVRLVFKDFPLPSHAEAPKASEAAHCAGEQGKYWEMHDKMFGNQQALKVADLKASAGSLGLDQGKFDQCLDSGKYKAKVEAAVAEGQKMGVQSTPTLYMNGRVISGAQPLEVFEAMLKEELELKGTK